MAEDRYDELDAEWSELLEEHRVAMPGAQVLFTFLLILPFQNRFSQLTDVQEYVYFSGFISAAIAIVLLITPTASHRIQWRQHDKETLLRNATLTSIVALVFLALAMTASIFLVADFLFDVPTTLIATIVIAALFTWFWFALPILRRLRV